MGTMYLFVVVISSLYSTNALLIKQNAVYRSCNSRRKSTHPKVSVEGTKVQRHVHYSSFIDVISNFDDFVQSSLSNNSPDIIQESAQQVVQLEDLKSAETIISALGNDLLIFLCATIGIVPLFKWLKASSVIGFLTAGLLMGPAGLGLFSDLDDMESIADFGVLFLLFEQGLELTVDRLKSLSKYAFGMGTAQVILSTAAFFTFPFIGGVKILEFITQQSADFVEIDRVDEALVIGAALSLSSSAFVLKILQEKGQLGKRFGAASLGILLLQDIAVVPLLVLLPIIESNSGPMPLSAQLSLLGLTFLKALLGLGGILVIGGNIVRFLFSLIAQTKSSETFVALVLLVALGTGALTDALGLSSTLGAFTAGTLLAESNYRTQIESDIKPFRGLLLGLFFVTTGASVDPTILIAQWPTVLALLVGLISFKAIITTLLGPLFGLTKSESVRTGLLLSGGGEFAFVVLTLADKLNVLPEQLAKVLVGVVVISMALTPYLSNLGDIAAEFVENFEKGDEASSLAISESNAFEEAEDNNESDVVVICGFGPLGERVSQFLSTSMVLESVKKVSPRPLKYVAFDLDPKLVMNGYRNGKKVLYGDGSQQMVLSTAGIDTPKAFVVTYADDELTFKAVERLRQSYPTTPIYSRASAISEFFHLKEAGVSKAVIDEQETSLSLGTTILDFLGVESLEIEKLRGDVRLDLELEIDMEYDKELYKKGFPTPGTNRKIEADLPIQKISQVLEDFSKRFKGVIDGPVSIQSDDVFVSSVLNREMSEDVNIENSTLGVDICPIPPKKQ